jgi:CheY-like chemotaxis protein
MAMRSSSASCCMRRTRTSWCATCARRPTRSSRCRHTRRTACFLYRRNAHADAPRPDLVPLDLNLPRKDGREEVKADPNLRTIPIVLLTTSEAEEDILRSYDLHANAYVTKPVDCDRFVEVVRLIDDFFVTVVKLPQRDRGRETRAGRGTNSSLFAANRLRRPEPVLGSAPS